jgi:hypothetical protein
MMRTMLTAAVFAACLAGCGNLWEQASVTISYGPTPESQEYRLVGDERKRVEAAFRQFSERNGYKCRPHIKRVEEITCRGPRDLHLVFQPSPNKPQFVAKFSWADISGRTHEEFMNHVTRFEKELSSAIGEDNVRLEGKT